VLVAVLALVGGLIIGGGDGGESLSRHQVARIQQQEAEPVHFTVSASGDLLIHSPLWERALELGGGHYDFAPELAELRPYVADASLGICHVETPMTPAPPTSYPIFNTPPALAQGIKATGWDICDTASNHSLDQGQSGIDDTGKALDSNGIGHTGSFPSGKAQQHDVVMKDVQGVKVAFLAYTTDTNGIPLPHSWSVNIASPKRILDDARKAHHEGAQAVIVNIHWGGEILPEYQQTPSSGQLKMVKELTKSPLITAIVGQGPHAVQPIERINDKFVVFSEGNLISNQSPAAGLPAESQDGMVVLLDCVTRGEVTRVTRVRYVPVFVSQPDYTVLPVGSALKKGEGDAALLRESYARTVDVVGKSKRIQPIPEKLPKG
jgi:poly-gamma-glutamate synthesis protein (capsule biosynthesis protein)